MFELGTLDQLADITMGQSPKGSSVSNSGEIPLLNGPTEFGINHPTPVQFTDDPKRFAKKGDLLFCVRGSTGRMNWADQDYAIGRGLAAIRPKDGSSYYFLRGSIQFFLKHLLSGATGSVFTSINKDQLHKMECFLPDEYNLKKINQVLGNISRKIELNQQMNETLEEITKTLFKSWFIDFDPVRAKVEGMPTGLSKEISDLFPDSFEDSELGGIPKGWCITSLNDITSKFTTGLNPRKNFVLGSGDNFYVTIKNLGDFEVVLDDKCDKVDDDAIKKINSRSDLKENDILFSGIGTIGKVVYVFDKVKNWNISESVFSLRANSEVTFPSFLYQLLKSYPLQGYVQALAGGSVQRGIRMGSLKEYQFTLSNFEVQQLFHETISPMIEKISLNLNETKNLINTRDTLLPNLISGELKIPDAEKLIEEASIK